MAFDRSPSVLLHGRQIQIAEAAAECDQVAIAQLRMPHEQHLMVEPGTVDRVECRGVDGTQVDAADLGADAPADLPDVQGDSGLGGTASGTISIRGRGTKCKSAPGCWEQQEISQE
jgi:hypothetical protein